MPYVVTGLCIGCKYTDCVEVCPGGCFYEGPNFLATSWRNASTSGASRAGVPGRGDLSRR